MHEPSSQLSLSGHQMRAGGRSSRQAQLLNFTADIDHHPPKVLSLGQQRGYQVSRAARDASEPTGLGRPMMGSACEVLGSRRKFVCQQPDIGSASAQQAVPARWTSSAPWVWFVVATWPGPDHSGKVGESTSVVAGAGVTGWRGYELRRRGDNHPLWAARLRPKRQRGDKGPTLSLPPHGVWSFDPAEKWCGPSG